MMVWNVLDFLQEWWLLPLLSGFPGGSVVKDLPAKQEIQFPSLGWEAPLEKEKATHSGILVWEIPWREETDGLLTLP